MSTLLEQVKWQHNSLLEALFKGKVGVIEPKHAELQKLLDAPPETNLPEEQRYLAEIKVFWLEHYCELSKTDHLEAGRRYEEFLEMGRKLQAFAYYDVAADVLQVATYSWGGGMSIHYQTLAQWKSLAENMRELRLRYAEIIKMDTNNIDEKNARILFAETQKLLKKAQQDLKHIGDNDEIRHVRNLLGKLLPHIPIAQDTQIPLSKNDVSKLDKLKELFQGEELVLVFGDYIKYKETGVEHAQTVFQQPHQTIHGTQTNLDTAHGPILSGEFNNSVQLDSRVIHSNGDLVEGDKPDHSIRTGDIKAERVNINYYMFSEAEWIQITQALRNGTSDNTISDKALPDRFMETLLRFQELHQQLEEWKQIHNHLTLIISMFAPIIGMFDPFSVPKDSGENTGIDSIQVKKQWKQVKNKVESYQKYCQKHVKKVCELIYDGNQSGDSWIVDIVINFRPIDNLLEIQSKTIYPDAGINLLSNIYNLHDALMKHLERVDSDLLSVATEIQAVSQQAFTSFDYHVRKTV